MSAGEGAWECGTAGQGGVTVAFVEHQAAVVGTGDDIRVVIAYIQSTWPDDVREQRKRMLDQQARQ